MKFEAEYTLYLNEKPEEEGAGSAAAEEENLRVLPKKAQPIVIPWTQVFDITFADYGAFFSFAAGKKLEIRSLGYKFEDFARLSSKFRNESLIKAYLAGENLKKSMIEAEISFSRNGEKIFDEACELRIYETSLIVLPRTHEFIRFPFRFIKKISEGDYIIEIFSENGETIGISGLGKKFDFFKESLNGQMNEMDSLVQKNLSSLFGGSADPLAVRSAAKLLKEGKVVTAAEVETRLPGFLAVVEKRLAADPEDGKEYGLLKSLSESEKTSFGVKKGLMGSMSGDYFIFLFFIKIPGNGGVAAFEAFSTEPKKEAETDKRATYFYRVPEKTDFNSFFNSAMTAVNFRRLPIMISEARLADPKYSAYRLAIDKIPELKELRRLYLGRVIHSEFESWADDIKALVKFAGQNPSGVWAKNCYTEEEEKED